MDYIPPKPAIFVPAKPAIHVRGEPQVAWSAGVGPRGISLGLGCIPAMLLGRGGSAHGSAQTAYNAGTLSTADSGLENNSYRVWTSSALSFTGTITQCRVRFVSGSSSTSKADNVSIGKQTGGSYQTTATPVEMLSSGASGFTITSGTGTQYTDWTDIPSLFTSSGSDVAVVVVDVAATNGNTKYTTSGGSHFYAASNTYNQANPGAGTSSALRRFFDLIEVRT